MTSEKELSKTKYEPEPSTEEEGEESRLVVQPVPPSFGVWMSIVVAAAGAANVPVSRRRGHRRQTQFSSSLSISAVDYYIGEKQRLGSALQIASTFVCV